MPILRFFPTLSGMFLLISSLTYAQSGPDREYRVLFGHPYDQEWIATNGIALNKAFQDIYYKGLSSRVPAKVRPIAETVWSVFWTFNFSMWPHDCGHWARARQIGGDFRINQYRFPFPVAEMIQPDSVAPGEEALASIGGHEINNLMMRQAHLDFYNREYSFAIDLIHAFIQEVYYPFYAFVLAPTNPEEPSTWIDTYGDPVESALIVYKSHTGREPLRDDGTVDPDLIRYYRDATYLSVLWTLLDPLLYQSARAFGADMTDDYGLMKPWMLGGQKFSWIWSTQFHYSPLGYELYLANYLRWSQKLYYVYVKTGRPFKNLGLGVSVPSLLAMRDFTLGVACDLWDQDIYGSGAALFMNAHYQASDRLGLILKGGWKDEGYLIGKRVEKSAIFFVGISYRY
ncbi:hypothetical protein ACFL45_08470 [Candidatus Neomarinimicrobiota bacterium]